MAAEQLSYFNANLGVNTIKHLSGTTLPSVPVHFELHQGAPDWLKKKGLEPTTGQIFMF